MDRLITIVTILIVICFLIDGIRRGLVRQLFEIIGLGAAFLCAYYVAHHIAGRSEGRLDLSHKVLLVGASVIVFIVVALLFHLLGVLLGKIASVTILGPVDKVGGGVFGALKGVLFVSLLCVVCFNLPLPCSFKEKLRNDPVAARIYPILPAIYDSVVKHSPPRPDLDGVVRAEAK